MKSIMPVLMTGLLIGASGLNAQEGPPLDLPIERDQVPSSGRCRVFIVEGMRIEDTLDFGCKNIENSVPLGSYIMMRSSKNREEVFLCRMSDSEEGVIDGIDVYSYSRLRLIRVVLEQARRTKDNTMTCLEAEEEG